MLPPEFPTSPPSGAQDPSDEMHPAYFEVKFHSPILPTVWPETFAIITAHAPTGQTRSAEQNQQANIQLLQTLIPLVGPTPISITGYSPTTGHAEPGWVVPLHLTQAQSIGHQFHQDAIYWIEHDNLYVIKCAPLHSRLVPAGYFRERLTKKSPPLP